MKFVIMPDFDWKQSEELRETMLLVDNIFKF